MLERSNNVFEMDQMWSFMAGKFTRTFIPIYLWPDFFPSSTIKEFLFAADVNSAMISSISAYCRDFDTCMWMICIVTLITI